MTEPLSDTTKKRIALLVVAILAVTLLYEILRPWQVAVDVLSRFPGEFGVPISSKSSWSDSYSYRRASYLLVPSLREVTITKLNQSAPNVQVAPRAHYIYIGLCALAAYFLWQRYRRDRSRPPNQRLERP